MGFEYDSNHLFFFSFFGSGKTQSSQARYNPHGRFGHDGLSKFSAEKLWQGSGPKPEDPAGDSHVPADEELDERYRTASVARSRAPLERSAPKGEHDAGTGGQYCCFVSFCFFVAIGLS